jgi:hypothetical protein
MAFAAAFDSLSETSFQLAQGDRPVVPLDAPLTLATGEEDLALPRRAIQGDNSTVIRRLNQFWRLAHDSCRFRCGHAE